MAEVTQGEATTTTPAEVPTTPAVDPAATPAQGAEPPKEEPKAPPPEKTFTQKELDRIIARERREYERHRKEAEERVRKEYAERFPEKPTAAKPSDQEPDPEDFKSPKEYVAAMVEWKLEQRAKEEQRKASEQQKRQSSESAAAYLEKRFAAAEEFPDLQERLSSDEVALSDPMLSFVLDTEHGFAVGDYLANNAAESRKIANLAPAKQILALAEIAGKLKAAPKPSAAPPPIVPNSGTGVPAKGYRPDMSAKEYKEWRERQIAQRNSR